MEYAPSIPVSVKFIKSGCTYYCICCNYGAKKIIPILFGAQHRAEKLPLALSGTKYYWILYRPEDENPLFRRQVALTLR